MAEYKDMHSSPPARAPKLQLTAEQLLTGGCWNIPKKRYPTSKDKEDTARQWEGHNHDEIKFHTHWVGDPQAKEQ